MVDTTGVNFSEIGQVYRKEARHRTVGYQWHFTEYVNGHIFKVPDCYTWKFKELKDTMYQVATIKHYNEAKFFLSDLCAKYPEIRNW